MELVAIARLLWERRLLVALGVLLAAAAAVLVGRAAPDASAGGGSGSVRLVLDTSDSQLVKAAPNGASTLPTRAWLLANTLATDAGRARVARAAGVPDEQLVVLSPAEKTVPVMETPLVKQVGAAVRGGNAPYVVDVSTFDEMPLISIKAYAPDAPRARKLAGAAADGLRAMMLRQDKSQSRGFVLDTVAPARATQLSSASRHPYLMAAGAMATLALWCGLVVLVAGTAHRLRSLDRVPGPA